MEEERGLEGQAVRGTAPLEHGPPKDRGRELS